MSCSSAFKGSSDRSGFAPRPTSLGCVVIGTLSLLVLSLALLAQAPAPVVSLHAAHAPVLKPGAQAAAKIEFAIAPGFHVQSDHPNSPFLIPTTLRFEPAHGIAALAVHWPRAEQLKFGFFPTPLAVFSGTLPVSVDLRAPASAPPGTYVFKGTLHYQACNDTLCRPPASLPVILKVHVSNR